MNPLTFGQQSFSTTKLMWNVTDDSSASFPTLVSLHNVTLTGINSSGQSPFPCDEDIPDDEKDTPGCTQYSFIVYTVITGCLCVFGSVGNILSFFVFYADHLKTSTSFLFQSLSVIDTLLLIGVFPLYCIPNFVRYTGMYESYTSHAEHLVLVYVFPLLLLAQTATIWTTVLVGLNRYIAVCMPYQAVRLCTVVQAKRQLAIVLLFSILYNAPRFAEGQLMYSETDKNGVMIRRVCAVHTDVAKNWWYQVIYQNVLYTIFVCLIPLLVLIVLNVRLMSALNDVKRRRVEMTLQSARQRQDNSVTLVLIVVIIVFVTCQFPALLTQIFWTAFDDVTRSCGGFQYYYSQISNVLVTANSALNFIIYFVFNQRFRGVLFNMLRGKHYPAAGSSAATMTTGATTGGGCRRMPSCRTAGQGPQTAAAAADGRVPLTVRPLLAVDWAQGECVAAMELAPPGTSPLSEEMLPGGGSTSTSVTICTSI